MREVFADFAKLRERPGIGLSVYLGSDRLHRQPLTDGEQVMLVEPDNLRAVATIVCREQHGERQWFGVLQGDIEDIHPETLRERAAAPHPLAS